MAKSLLVEVNKSRNMNIKNIVYLICLLLILFSCEKKAEEQRIEKPNIIFILTDDQRYDYLGITGNPYIETPHLDQLARDGVLFEQAYMTSPLCMPSRASLFTGQYTRRHGIDFSSNNVMKEENWQKTYPMILKRNGYYVGFIGKNHVPVGPNGWFGNYMKNTYDYWYGNMDQIGFYPKDNYKQYFNAKSNTQIEVLEEGMTNFLQQNDCFAGTDSFLIAAPRDKPFCLAINLNVPHSNGTGSMQQRRTDDSLYRTAYRNLMDSLPMVANYLTDDEMEIPKLPDYVIPPDYGYKGYNYTKKPETMREQMVRVMQTVTGVDRMVGHIREQLKVQGLADNTIIIFTSDHGIQFGEHGLRGKTFLYDPSIKVPLIMYDPTLPNDKNGRRISEFALGVDIAPTILEAAGVPVPEHMQGQSLYPLLHDDYQDWRQEFFCENNMVWQKYPRIEGVRTHEWKYIRYFPNVNQSTPFVERLEATIKGEEPIYEELYYLTKDPGETNNLAKEDEYQSKLIELREKNIALVKKWRGENPPTHYDFK